MRVGERATEKEKNEAVKGGLNFRGGNATFPSCKEKKIGKNSTDVGGQAL